MPASMYGSDIEYSDKTSGTTLFAGADLTSVGNTAPAGTCFFMWAVFDNLTATTPTVSSIDKQSGETANWSLIGFFNSPQAGAAAGVRGELWMIKTTIAWSNGVRLAALSGNVTSRVSVGWAVQALTGTIRQVVSGVGSASSTLPEIGDAVFGLAGTESNSTPTQDTDTTNGTWNTFGSVFTTGGGGASNAGLLAQYKIPIGTGTQTFNTAVSDGGCVIAVLEGVDAPEDPTTAPTVAAGVDKVTVTTPALATSTNADSFNIYRGATLVATGINGSTSVDDTGASASANQTYTVKGVNVGGESVNSPASSAVVADPGFPTFNLKVGNTKITVRITKKPYDAAYKVYRGLSGGSRTLVHTSTTQTGAGTYSWENTGLINDTVYDYTVVTSVSTPTARDSSESAIQSANPSEWVPLTYPDTYGRAYNTAQVVGDFAYFISGYKIVNNFPDEEGKNWRYDIVNDTWLQRTGPSVFPFYGSCVINGIIYTNGSQPSGSPNNRTFAYNPSTDTWTEKADATGMAGFSNSSSRGIVAYNGKMYVFMVNEQIHEYDPVGNTWTNVGPTLANIGISDAVLIGTTVWLTRFVGTNEHLLPIDMTTLTVGTQVDIPTSVERIAGLTHAQATVNDKLMWHMRVQNPSVYTGQVLLFNPSNSSFVVMSTTAPLRGEAYSPSSQVIHGENYYLFGGGIPGTSSGPYYTTFYVYEVPSGDDIPVAGSASFTLSASGIDASTVQATSLLSLTASGADKATISGAASILLTGAAQSVEDTPASGSSLLELTASGLQESVISGTALLELAANGVENATNSGVASLALNGSGSVELPSEVSGIASLQLSASGFIQRFGILKTLVAEGWKRAK